MFKIEAFINKKLFNQTERLIWRGRKEEKERGKFYAITRVKVKAKNIGGCKGRTGNLDTINLHNNFLCAAVRPIFFSLLFAPLLKYQKNQRKKHALFAAVKPFAFLSHSHVHNHSHVVEQFLFSRCFSFDHSPVNAWSAHWSLLFYTLSYVRALHALALTRIHTVTRSLANGFFLSFSFSSANS